MTKEEKEALIRDLKSKIDQHSKIVEQYKTQLKRVENTKPRRPDESLSNKPPIPKIIY